MMKSLRFLMAAAVLAIATTSAQAITILSYDVDAGSGFGNPQSDLVGAASELATLGGQNFGGINGTTGSNIAISDHVLNTNSELATTDVAGGVVPFSYDVKVWVNGNMLDSVNFLVTGKFTITNIAGGPGGSITQAFLLTSPLMNSGMSAITNTVVDFNFASFDQLDPAQFPGPLFGPYKWTTGGLGQASAITYRLQAGVPEPGSMALLFGAGVTGLVFIRRRK
jgi:hypothetical protein